MTIKLTMTDGTVIEGTTEEIAELQRLTGVKPKYKEGDSVKLQVKGEPSFDLSVGDYAKVTGLTVFGDITEGSYVKIVEDIGSGSEYKIELIDGSDCDFVEPEALEKVELTNRDLTFIKAGRKPGEFKKGDIVDEDGEIYFVNKVKAPGYISANKGMTLVKPNGDMCWTYLNDAKLIAPVEARVDR